MPSIEEVEALIDDVLDENASDGIRAVRSIDPIRMARRQINNRFSWQPKN